MDNKRIAKLYNKVFSTPRKSPERDKLVEGLSDNDSSALREYTLGVMAGRIKHNINDIEQEGAGMTYAEFKRLSDGNESGAMRELSKFAMENPSLYEQHRAKYQEEYEQRLKLHNRGMARI